MPKEHFLNISDTSKDFARFGLGISTGLLLLGTIALWNNHYRAFILLTTGILLALLGLLSPRALKPLYFAWTALIITSGLILMHVFLAVAYYLVVTPIGLTSRVLRSLSFSKTTNHNKNTYWQSRSADQTDRESLKRQF